MNFQQLRIVRETVRRNFNLTEVANSLFTSQSGVSKHIKDLEDELGVELFVRRGKRLLGLTDPGKEMVEIVERILADTANIKRLGEQFCNREQGQLVIATTHTQARYVLPHVVAAFRTAYPKVHLTLHQGSPTEIASMLVHGDADIGICTETLRDVPALISVPVLQLAPRRGRPQGPRAGRGQGRAAHPGGDRRVADHHLPRGLHRPRQHRPRLRQGRPDTRHRHVGDGYRRAQGLRRAGPRRRHHRRHGLQREARHRAEAHRRQPPVRCQHGADRRAPRQLPAHLRLPLHRAVLAGAAGGQWCGPR